MSFSYVASYDSKAVRGQDDPSTKRPWNLIEEILKYVKTGQDLLDVGCGTASKIIPIAFYFRKIIGLDISENMIESALKNIHKNKIGNIKLIHGNSYFLPFKDNSYDIISCMLSRWNINELHRVLKPNGIVIIEHIGCEDKKELKLLFGKDKDGWRGQFIEFQKAEYLQHYRNLFNNLFDSVHIQNGYWDTFYTKQGLLDLLKFTPTIRNFDLKKDDLIYKKATSIFNEPQGIKLTQNRILIYAKKSN